VVGLIVAIFLIHIYPLSNHLKTIYHIKVIDSQIFNSSFTSGIVLHILLQNSSSSTDLSNA
jgi:hypothetical protein